MKLSDAAVLGLSITQLEKYDWDACFLGSAGNAAGIKKAVIAELEALHDAASLLATSPTSQHKSIRDGIHALAQCGRKVAVAERWPWLDHLASQLTEFPESWSASTIYAYENIWRMYDVNLTLDRAFHRQVIAYLFDVSRESKSEIFSQVLDYVKLVEPQCGECNQFTCTCAPVTESQEVVLEAV